MSSPHEAPRLSRRRLLVGGGTAVVAAVVGLTATDRRGAPEPATTQAGVDRPATPPPSLELAALRAGGPLPGRAEVADLLAGLGVAALAAGAVARAGAGAAGEPTIQVGIGPRLLATVDPTLPAAEPMPAFRGDAALPAERLEADLVVAVAGHDAAATRAVAADLVGAAPGFEVAWSQAGYRPPGGSGPATVNPLGFVDGVMVPRTPAELAANVWIEHGPAAGGTVGVVRRFRLDLERFGALPIDAQEQVIGRSKATGAPLSGGSPDDEVDLLAKSPNGEYLIPARSHVRAAHPSFTGSRLMLRRSYGYDDGASDRGLLFVSYQSDLATFVRTQQRMDDTDDLMAFATPTAAASFLVLPGFDERRPLGGSLFAR